MNTTSTKRWKKGVAFELAQDHTQHGANRIAAGTRGTVIRRSRRDPDRIGVALVVGDNGPHNLESRMTYLFAGEQPPEGTHIYQCWLTPANLRPIDGVERS